MGWFLWYSLLLATHLLGYPSHTLHDYLPVFSQELLLSLASSGEGGKSPENIRLGHWCGHAHPGEEILSYLHTFLSPFIGIKFSSETLVSLWIRAVGLWQERYQMALPSRYASDHTVLVAGRCSDSRAVSKGTLCSRAGFAAGSPLTLQASWFISSQEKIPCRRNCRKKKDLGF